MARPRSAGTRGRQAGLEAVVLAGGLGLRLRPVLGAHQKVAAPVAGVPFLDFVIGYLRSEGVRRVALALGYRHQEVLRLYRGAGHGGDDVVTVVEPSPLGTGGAIAGAASVLASD